MFALEIKSNSLSSDTISEDGRSSVCEVMFNFSESALDKLCSAYIKYVTTGQIIGKRRKTDLSLKKIYFKPSSVSVNDHHRDVTVNLLMPLSGGLDSPVTKF